MPWSVRSFRFFTSSFFFKMVKTVTAHLCILLWKKLETWSMALVGLTLVKGRSVRKQVTKKERKISDASPTFENQFGSKSIKMDSKNHQQNDHPKTWNLMPKGSQNGPKINTKSHHKSMPKLVTKNIRKFIKNHVTLNGKSLKFILKINSFDGLEDSMCER